MHVLCVNYEYPGVTANCGGGGEVTRLLADGLEDRGHTVTVVTDEADGHYATFPARSYRRLRNAIATEQPDVVHGHFSLPTSLFLPQLAGDTPFVVSVMGAEVYDPTRFSGLRPVMDRLNDYIFNAADAVVALSSDMADRISRKHGHHPRIIPYGLADGTPWHSRDATDQVRVLTVCRHVERKNLDVALHAVDAFRETTDVDVQYRLAGTGPLTDSLKAEWGESDWIEFRGFVDDLDAEYDWGGVFLLPSAHEAFGIVYLEALQAGLPVVASDCGGQTDFISGDVGKTVQPTVPAVTRALRAVHADYPAYQAATEDYVTEQWSAERTIDDYEELYEAVV